MRWTVSLLVALAACAPASVPPATTPPPPPTRAENAVALRGNVFDSAGQPVPHALIRAWGADPSCRAVGEGVRVWGGASSSYDVTVERSVGPAERGCVVIEARAGGANARRTMPVTFATPGPVVEADINLGPPARLTRKEADRIVEVLRLGITTRDRAAVDELAGYLGLGPEQTGAQLGEIQRHLRTVTAVTFLSEENGRFIYDLTGHREPALRVTISQDSLTRVELPDH